MDRRVRIRRLSACVVCGRPTHAPRCSTHRARLSLSDPEYLRNRALVLAGSTHCAICSERFTVDDPATVDHRVALIDGGDHRLSNLRAAHRSCNGRKGALEDGRA